MIFYSFNSGFRRYTIPMTPLVGNISLRKPKSDVPYYQIAWRSSPAVCDPRFPAVLLARGCRSGARIPRRGHALGIRSTKTVISLTLIKHSFSKHMINILSNHLGEDAPNPKLHSILNDTHQHALHVDQMSAHAKYRSLILWFIFCGKAVPKNSKTWLRLILGVCDGFVRSSSYFCRFCSWGYSISLLRDQWL